MGSRYVLMAMALGVVLAGAAHADLKAALAEPNLEKRSKLALENANSAYEAARTAYDAGQPEAVAAALKELQESVEVAYSALQQTGKDPRKYPKWFKKAEMETRDMLRRLDAFQNAMSFDDRAVVDPVKARLQQVHDDLLLGLMEGKRKK